MKRTAPALFMAILAVLTLLTAGCQARQRNSTPDYPVTVIPPADTPIPTQRPPAMMTPEPVYSPTFDWSNVTLVPLPSEEAPEEGTPAPTPPPQRSAPDPFTQNDLDLLASEQYPFEMTDAEISLGRLVLPVDLLGLAGMSFRLQSVPVVDQPGWRFLAFDLPLPTGDGLGALVRAPISGQVMAGTMQMINNEMVETISIDHPLGDDQMLRATFVYSGTIEPLYMIQQQVKAGEVLFRLTRDTGRLALLGNTPIPGGATLTLHAFHRYRDPARIRRGNAKVCARD